MWINTEHLHFVRNNLFISQLLSSAGNVEYHLLANFAVNVRSAVPSLCYLTENEYEDTAVDLSIWLGFEQVSLAVWADKLRWFRRVLM